MSEPTNRLWVKCGHCGNVWVALELPMKMIEAARRMKGLSCEKCGEAKEIYVAKTTDIPAGGTA